MMKKIARFLQILWQRFKQDDCANRAAALTFTTLLSLVPLMAVSLAVLSAFPLFRSIGVQIQSFIFENFVATSGEAIQAYLQRVLMQTGNLSVIGLIFLLITAILMMYNMDAAFNEIWHVRERRKGVPALLTYWAVLTLAPIFVGTSLLISSYVISLRFVSDTVTTLGLVKPLLTILPFICSWTTFSFLYAAIPNEKVPLLNALFSGLIAACLFELAKFGFAIYVATFPSYTLLYGALATIPIFFLWVYISWVIILVGAIICHMLTVEHEYRAAEKIDPFTQLYRWLGHFWLAFQSGESLSLQELINRDECDYQVSPLKQLDLLRSAHLIQAVSGNRFVLAKDLTHFTLAEFQQIIPWRLPLDSELKSLPGEWENNLRKVLFSYYEKSSHLLDESLARLYSKRSSV